MTSSAKTLRALERAAMGWYDFCISVGATKESFGPQARKLFLACVRHSAALKRKRTGRR